MDTSTSLALVLLAVLAAACCIGLLLASAVAASRGTRSRGDSAGFRPVRPGNGNEDEAQPGLGQVSRPSAIAGQRGGAMVRGQPNGTLRPLGKPTQPAVDWVTGRRLRKNT
jgi:hypothetical protein